MERKAYSRAAKDNAIEYIQRMRSVIELPHNSAMAGSRFDNDDAVYARLESMYAEAEFNNWPMACVEAALIDAAQSDYWYQNEKQYDYTEEVEDHTEEDPCS